MAKQFSKQLPNALVLISDRDNFDVPTSMNQDLVSCTSSTLAIGAAVDAATSIVIAFKDEAVSKALPGMVKIFACKLLITSGVLEARTTHNELLASISLSKPTAKVTVWSDHLKEPTSLLVELCSES